MGSCRLQGRRASVAGQPRCVERLVLEPPLPFVSFSLYCPKDNIEEALLLLLISESMVSSRPFPLCRSGVGLQGSGTGRQVLTQLSLPRMSLKRDSCICPLHGGEAHFLRFGSGAQGCIRGACVGTELRVPNTSSGITKDAYQ